MKHNNNKPKIYTGGVTIDKWSSLTKPQQKVALSKDRYVYFAFRDPVSGKLIRQPNIKGGVNLIKNMRDRLEFLVIIQQNVLLLLKAGANSYGDNSKLKQQFLNPEKSLKVVLWHMLRTKNMIGKLLEGLSS